MAVTIIVIYINIIGLERKQYSLFGSFLGDLFRRKYQNYPALDNRSNYFCMIMNIYEETGKMPKNQSFDPR